MEKTPEQNTAEKIRKARAMSDAISHFSMKLRCIQNTTPIEEQVKYLSNYHDIPSEEELIGNKNEIDSYREEFLNAQYDDFFAEYPEMLERLGDKRTENNMANFLGLRLMSYLFSSNEVGEAERKENIEAYFRILPKYQDFLIDYIVSNNKWELTINSKEAFLAYYGIQKEHDALIQKYPAPLDAPYLIRDVRTIFYDKILKAQELGLDKDTYSTLVSNVVIGKFLALKFVMDGMAGIGADAIRMVAGTIFQKYSLDEITLAAKEAEEKFSLNEHQKSQMKEVEEMLQFLRKQGFGSSGSSGSGCMLIILLLLIPVSLLAYIL